MRSTSISIIAAALLIGTTAFGAQETVKYPDLKGFDSITYTSEFFGYQSGVNRDFTNYGRGFADPVVNTTGWGDAQVALADINGDGLDDLVGFTESTQEMRWAQGKGDGSFDIQGFHEMTIKQHGRLAAADFNGDGRTDLAFIDDEVTSILYGKPSGGFSQPLTLNMNAPSGQIAAGDFDGDNLADICVYNPTAGTISIMVGKKGGGFGEPVASTWKPGKIGGTFVVADFNGDHYCDIALYASSAFGEGFYFRFGRGNGMFGPTTTEEKTSGSTHLWSKFGWIPAAGAVPVAGQIDDDGSADIALYIPSSGLFLSRIQAEEPAYDYSVHLMKEGSKYRMWHGGRWRTLDKDGNTLPAADGDHVMYAWSADGRKWFRKIDGAVFPKGDELGIHDWWTNNFLEPEVLKVKGKYYMYWQAEIDPGSKVDTGEKAVKQSDRIGLSTSTDGVNWKRKTDRGVIINIPNPTVTNIDHQEVIYVPDDKDGKPWWLYTFHFVDGKAMGHVRIRSNDPTTFDWNLREHVNGMSQIGNQTGYADEAPGGRMFFRITFSGNGQNRTVPTLQLSRDGLNWMTGQEGGLARPLLAGSTNEKNNRNVYFLGMSTIDGTGKLEHLGNGKFHALYGTTSVNGPGQPHIWHAEIGIGEVYITFNKDKR